MLKPALSQRRFEALQAWSEIPTGEWLQAEVAAQLDGLSERIFGYYFARVGALSASIPLPHLRVRRDISIAPSGTAAVIAQPTAWPFGEHSLDGLLSVLQLEFQHDPHLYLRELSRSLVANGYFIHVGMNPFALAQLRRLAWWQQQPSIFAGRWFSQARVKDWLHLLNFEVVDSGYFAPTMLIESLDSGNRVQKGVFKLLPKLSAMYYIVGRKREYPLTWIKLRPQVKQRLQTMPLANRLEQ